MDYPTGYGGCVLGFFGGIDALVRLANMPYVILTDGNGQQRSVPVEKDRFTIGKKDTNDLVLQDRLVSREHCQIIQDAPGRYILRDLGSRNGTFAGGQQVKNDVLLRDGMDIRIGRIPVRFLLRAPDLDSVQSSSEAKQDSQAETLAEEKSESEKEKPTPVALKKKAHSRLLEKLDLKHEDFSKRNGEEIREKASRAIKEIVEELSDEIPDWVDKESLVKEISDEALGLGPLEDMLADPEIDEIMVNNWDHVYVERHGRIEKTNKRFTDNQQVINIIRRIISPIGRRIDESSPMVDARLPDGSRVNAIIKPLALTGPTLTIRKFAADPFTVRNLIDFGTLSPQIAEFLKLAVKSRKNIVISGGTGSGKTTLLNVICCWLPQNERIVTIEDAAELKLPQEHVVSLEAKPPNIRGEGAIPIRKLVINSLRMRPDRIIVGECRGGEALDMLQAMNTGHDGSLTTLHANSPRDALSRLETMVLMAGMELPSRAIREQVTSAVDLLVHTARLPDGTRKVMDICEVVGMQADKITMQQIYEFRQRGYDENGKVVGYFTATGTVPRFVQELRERRVEVNLGLFNRADKAKEEEAEKKKRAQK